MKRTICFLAYLSAVPGVMAAATPPARTTVTLGAIAAGETMTPPSAPVTEVVFRNGDWRPQLRLPAEAADRARIVVRSTAAWQAEIADDNVDIKGTLKLKAQDVYQFVYVKEKALWYMTAHPKRVRDAASLPDGQIADMDAPSVKVSIAEQGASTASLKLPASAKGGDDILVDNADSKRNYEVTARQVGTSRWTVHPGETLRFTYTPEKGWQQNMFNVKMVLVYGDGAVKRYGEAGARARLLHGVKATNSVLLGSRVNLSIAPAGFVKRQYAGNTGAVLKTITEDAEMQSARALMKAHGVYYDGADRDSRVCGTAYIGTIGVPTQMVGTTVLGCSPLVMQHEFGHLMGIEHWRSEPDAAPDARGYGPEDTLVTGDGAGEKNPYFSNPDVLNPDTGRATGVKDIANAAREMNAVASKMLAGDR